LPQCGKPYESHYCYYYEINACLAIIVAKIPTTLKVN
jgi:hypothetical protein